MESAIYNRVFINQEIKKNSRMSNFSCLLPWEIIEEIIPRLPARSIKRFRCVSKSWNQFITSPLCLQHFEQFNHNSDYHTKLLITSTGKNQNFNQIDCPLDHIQFQKFTVLGFCNGLVCVQDFGKRISLWNFVTNEHIDLPEELRKGNRASCFLSEGYGFGYAPRSDDYIVCKFCSHRPADYDSYMDVYSLRYNKWERIEDIPYSTAGRESGILVSGAVHWLGTPRNREVSIVIACDLDDKNFRELSLPDFDDNTNNSRNVVLDALHGCLCVLRRTKFGHVELWMMKEYGFKSTSWTKLYNIKIDGSLYYYSKLLCFTNSGANLLLRDGSNILSYDTKGGSIRKLVTGDITKYHFGAVAYIESFVSLQSYHCQSSKKRKRLQNAA
ncbi:hypothetical protein AQUCO_04900106v1 [Aquilegia coerulea]|uniref:F-box domain-containing protein n=1 Tax=Aquilegia coerulea TaxID=218851 RepID=A0A2G5CJW0_AQUCA|nr:hypothetical protein AQUCO_04900106v1 [Aquilegia coerulea]